jgi:hypothetical protein
MAYCAYITKIKNLRKHSNAERLLVGECFGNSTIVSTNTTENELGVYFPIDGKLCAEYCEENNLLRKKDADGNQIGGFLDPDKRKIQAIKLRGEMSDGLFMPLKSLDKFTDTSALKEGDSITILNGLTICEKYIPRGSRRRQGSGTPGGKKNKKVDQTSFPLFMEHYDTSQLAYNKHVFREGDQCEITLKMHGTSQRTAYTLKETKKYLPYWLVRVLKSLRLLPKIKKSWEYVCGTRRVVLKSSWNDGWYGSNNFRQQHHEKFIGKLQKGETVYYEVVGYVAPNVTIMSDCSNKKTNDKEFVKQYGETTRFTYGCEDGQSDIYIYRMSMTNEDGYVVEYPYDLVKTRCEQMGLKYCPEYERFTFTTIEDLMERVEKYWDGVDPIGQNHIKEGVVVRIANRERFTAFKHKNWHFKVLEGIIKDTADAPDMEEAQEIMEEDFK